jgi:signal transduction histidine kinase
MAGASDTASFQTAGFAPLGTYERSLFGGIVYSRIAILIGLGLLLPDEPASHGDRLTIAIAVAWALTLVWVLVPLRSLARAYAHVGARPRLVWIDVAVWAALLVVAGGWENLFYVYGWSPFGFASVFWSARRTLLLGMGGCAVLVASHIGWRITGGDPATRSVPLSAWAAPVVGYLVVAGLFAYVRHQFDELAAAAAAYARRAADAIAAARSAAVAAERQEVAYRLHGRLRQAFPALALRIAALRADWPDDPAAGATLDAVSSLAARADAELDVAIAELRGGGTPSSGTFETGPGPGGSVP